jgi:succinoglycan biosynthesis protein ExoA
MPDVSLIMPCFNEAKRISRALESLVDDYVKKHAEILVIDGLSTDRTVETVVGYIEQKFPIRLLKNENRLQCFALNQGILAAQGKIIIRVDAHSVYPEGYVKKLIELSEKTGAANVGGIMRPVGTTPVQQAIALAMQHPMGVGNAKFHLGNYRGWVDTVYLGAFKREIFTAVGLFDTRCRTNEDAELNIRILKSGGKIYLDSSIQVEYLPRETLFRLAIQYFRYGQGRAYTTVKHSQITSYRQVAPPLLVLGLMGTLILSFFSPYFLLVWGCYLLTLLAVSLITWSKRKIPLGVRWLMGASFFLMHTAWGLGFLVYFLQFPAEIVKKRKKQ